MFQPATNGFHSRLSLTAGLIMIFCSTVYGQQQDFSGEGDLKYIDPRIGNVGQILEPTRPTVQLPNQVIRMFPQRRDDLDDQISSFPLTIVSHRQGEVFSLKPLAGSVTQESRKAKMTWDHDLEVTRPWYYSTLLDDQVQVEFVPGSKTGYYRFGFPANSKRTLLFDTYNEGPHDYRLISATEIEGTETYHGNIRVYMYGVFTAPASPVPEAAAGIMALAFAGSTPGPLGFKYAVSFISREQARKNFEHELQTTDFDALRKKGEQAWAKVIGQIRTEGGTTAQKRSFYTALYRTHERMVDITEDGQYFSGFDNKIHQTTRPFYVDDWAWDTYLAHHPLRTILDPAAEEDMLNSYVQMYEQSGWMPTFPVLFGDHVCMNGFHSTVSFLDAYQKGLRRFDLQKAYEGMRKNATQATMLPWKNGPKTPLDDFYYRKGYFPALAPGQKESYAEVDPFEKRQAVAVTLGASYDDWALGQLAGKLDKTADAANFKLRGQNYRHLWNQKAGMFLPKDGSGNWIDIDPEFDGGMGGRDYYDENNGWTYLWQVQQDIGGLIKLMGGKAAFESRLDQLFRQPLGRSNYAFHAKFPDATGLVGQYSMGNEPSFHIPYLYNYAGAPWKTQKRIRFLLDTWFKDTVFGIPGDEDGGGMSAFVVFSAMGFYPVTPGIPEYTIGSPLFEKTSIALPNGKTFELIARHCSVKNKYIQHAALNGKVLDRPWFTHAELVAGGKLELEMGPLPNKSWGLMP